MIPAVVWAFFALLALVALVAICPREPGRIVLPAVRTVSLIITATAYVSWLFLR